VSQTSDPTRSETAPGDEASGEDHAGGVVAYTVGLGLAALLTIVSFVLPTLNLVWAPSLPVALAVLAIAQMGVHLVFFLHLTTGPDNVNNVLALAFGVLVVFLVIGGSLWIMYEMNANMMPHGGMGM
jgi:cytochrome o ubiquinol oxidase operon protein cyoD